MLKNVILAMSGGVDSAVAGVLLKRKGYNVTAVFMKNWDIADETGNCSVEKDYEDAQWVCNKLRIPLVQINFVKDYWNEVFSDLIDKYQSGATPNPDILCNKKIKFNKFFHLARERFKADAIATGHYVQTSFGPYLEHYNADSKVHLLQACDRDKDQTFFLCQVQQDVLRHCMFPLGQFLKCNVKKIAEDAGLSLVAKKKESMGICFIGKREFKDFIAEYVEDKPGNFIGLKTGCVQGRHNGIHKYTIGQRCKIGGMADGCYVFQKDIENNQIITVEGTDNPALYSDFIITEDVHWISDVPKELLNAEGVLNCQFRFQHRNPLIDCKVFKSRDDRLLIQLGTPLRALTKGQVLSTLTPFYIPEKGA